MVLVSLVILAIGIFFISGEVGFFNRRYTLKAYIADAGGLKEGAQVRLAGVAVGNVKAVQISPFSERARAVEILMRVARNYQDQIRVDSVASIETVGLLGESYVNLTRGGPGKEVIPDGGVLKSSEEADIKRVVQNANDVVVNLRGVSTKLNDISAQIESGKGSLGKLIYDATLYNRLDKTANTLDQVVTRIDQGQGTVGKLLADETFYDSARGAVDRVNKLLDNMQHGPGSFAKFVSDPSLYDHAHHLVSQADSLVEGINQGHGSLGKLVKESELYDRMNTTIDHFDTISGRMADGQGTLGKLSTDPTLYNNLSKSSESMRDFLAEFKKNPKKYLSIKLHIF
jgi:phospholipid/cholesterol/gamma-HCH transport system substrate-binding protein